MMQIRDLTGQVFGVWAVLEKAGLKHGNVTWLCQCEKCGNTIVKQGRYLIRNVGLNCKCITDKPYKHDSELKKLVATYSDNEIGKMFGVSGATIRYFRKKFKIPPCKIKKRNSIYSLNTQFFKEIKNEYQAYTLGFLCADGYVNKNGKNVTIAIKQSDSQILDDIKKAMGSNSKLGVKKKPEGQEDLAVLFISSVEIVADLAKLGIIPNKTKVAYVPTLNPELYKHFIRGLFDGDGYVGTRQFVLTGSSKKLLLQVQDHIMRGTGCRITLRELKKKDGSVRGYQLVGGRKTKQALQWLYTDCKIVLHRKYKSYIDYWE